MKQKESNQSKKKAKEAKSTTSRMWDIGPSSATMGIRCTYSRAAERKRPKFWILL
jgi:hypothetical protein